ncbi:histidine kinase [Spirilliplanes yamanashiensis]|uniref:histidine kinase n=1 Tax=Spirilliplanes yamanashiensis TaxID=42233 RepID=A0A8J3YDS9_9ACTN|nr:histidine kinase [Spirilliplanes yamanashiensis]MDP9816355.1 signal transduction histidine kinase [Spirilliplanes yamanashiensis]GIJ05882.1 two-component sensor histidine kinase [Spirilliplanes yamanashiensis]
MRWTWRDAGWALAGAVAGVLWYLLAASEGDEGLPPRPVVLAATALAALAVLAWRRRRPVLLAALTVTGGVFLVGPAGAAPVALYAVGRYRSRRVTVAVSGLAAVLVTAVYAVFVPGDRLLFGFLVAVHVLPSVIAAELGMLARSRRELLAALEERARLAEEGQRRHAEEARQAERERIAREMHDVLAHRLSLLAVHAGALEFGEGLGPRERQAVGVVRQGAYEALEDLREVLGLLRADGGDADRPQPTLADLPALVAESRLAGARVELDRRVDGDVPGSVGRHAYRVVQEGLTNARKHAGGAPVRVSVAGDAAAGLTVEVVNPAGAAGASGAAGAAPAVPGGGAGLIGLAERVRLLGGRLDHGRAGGDFRLVAWLPWRP